MGLAFASNSGNQVLAGNPMSGLTKFSYVTWFYRAGAVAGSGKPIMSCGLFSGAANLTQLTMPVVSAGASIAPNFFVRCATTSANTSGTNVTPLVDNAWNFAAGTYDDSTKVSTAYSGQIGAPCTATTPSTGVGALGSYASVNLTLGHNQDTPTNSAPVTISMAALYNRALTQAELWLLQFNPWLVLPGCLMYYNLDRPDSQLRPVDLSGHGFHGVITGTQSGLVLPSFRISRALRTRFGVTAAGFQPAWGIPAQTIVGAGIY